MGAQEVAGISRLLLAATTATSEWRDLSSALEHLVGVLADSVRQERVVLYGFDARIQAMEVLATSGSPVPALGCVLPLESLTDAANELIAGEAGTLIDYDALETDSRKAIDHFAMRLVYAVPVVSHGAVRGALLLDVPGQRHQPTSAEKDLAEAFAMQVATTMEMASIFAEQELRASRLEALNEMLSLATSSLDPVEVVRLTLDHIVRRLGVDLVTLWRFDAEAQRLFPVSDVGMGSRFGEKFADGIAADAEYAVGMAFARRRPVVLDKGRLGEIPSAVRDAYEELGLPVGALLVLPVPGRHGTRGAITLAWTEPRWLDDDDVAFFSSAISALAIAAENAELYDELRQRRERVEALHAVTEAAVSCLDASETSRRTVRYLTDELGVDMSAVWHVDGDQMWLLATAGYPDIYAEKISPLPLDSVLDAPAVARTGELRVCEDVAESAQSTRAFFDAIGVTYGAFLIVPVQARGETLGTLNMAWAEPRRISPADIDFYTSVANEIGIALENARLFEAQVRAEREVSRELATSSLLLRTANSFAELSELGSVMFALGEIVLQATPHTRVTVHLWDERRRELRVCAATGLDPAPLGLITRWDEFSPGTQEVLLTREGAVVDIAEQPAGEHSLADAHGISYVLVLPIVRGERLIGLVSVDDADTRRDFLPREIEILEAITAQGATAIENARLFEAEHHVAETLQHALLELPEVVHGIRHAQLYRSATETAQVGGDFYDLFEITPERIGIVIGDVSGKGLEAASMTATVRDTLRVCALDGLSPAATIGKTNDMLCRFTPVEVFVTLFFGTLDTRTGALTYVAAGHPAPLVLHALGEVDSLVSTGPIVGAFPGTRYEEYAATFREGDVLVLFTDGLVEARRERELYGEERAAAALARAAATGMRDLEGLLGVLSEDAREFADGNLRDDMALLAVLRESQES